MDIRRRNTWLVLFILLFLSSCGSSKFKGNTKTVDRVNSIDSVVIKQAPYKMLASETIKINKLGEVKPFKLELEHNGAKSVVGVKNNEVILSVTQLDTVTLSTTVNKKAEVKEVTIEQRARGFWRTIKNNILFIAIISLIFNAISIGVKLSRKFMWF